MSGRAEEREEVEEEVMSVASLRGATVQDHVALVEIELCGELMIAASAAEGDRLSPDLIDEVLNVGRPCPPPPPPGARPQ